MTDQTAREELAQSIATNLDRVFLGTREFSPATQDYVLADALLAEGWGKLAMQVAPVGYDVTAPMVEDVWNTFVKPGQSDDAAPQSAEMRVLMAILRGVFAALEPQP